jgi:hypothetical protein
LGSSSYGSDVLGWSFLDAGQGLRKGVKRILCKFMRHEGGCQSRLVTRCTGWSED